MNSQPSARESRTATRTTPLYLARGQSNYEALKSATARMWQALRGVPKDIQNVVYGFTRAESRQKRGHLMGNWPDVARSCAVAGAPMIDVMAPVYEVERQLRREVYRNRLPSLLEAECAEADAACALKKAEVAGDPLKIIQAAIEEREASGVLVEVAEMGVVA